eukprot:3348897-Rhodomonas_salina.1
MAMLQSVPANPTLHSQCPSTQMPWPLQLFSHCGNDAQFARSLAAMFPVPTSANPWGPSGMSEPMTRTLHDPTSTGASTVTLSKLLRSSRTLPYWAWVRWLP